MMRLPICTVLLTCTFLFVAPSGLMADEVSGVMKSVSILEDQFLVTDENGRDLLIYTNAQGNIRLNDKMARLVDIKPGDQVNVLFDVQDGKNLMKELRAERQR